jgi:hypothetical protein
MNDNFRTLGTGANDGNMTISPTILRMFLETIVICAAAYCLGSGVSGSGVAGWLLLLFGGGLFAVDWMKSNSTDGK